MTGKFTLLKSCFNKGGLLLESSSTLFLRSAPTASSGGTGLRFFDKTARMFRRRVDRKQLQGRHAGIRQIMPCPGRNKNSCSRRSSALTQIVPAVPGLNGSIAARNEKELIGILMSFESDIFTRIQAHQRYLKILSGPKHFTKVSVSFRRTGKIRYKRRSGISVPGGSDTKRPGI